MRMQQQQPQKQNKKPIFFKRAVGVKSNGCHGSADSSVMKRAVSASKKMRRSRKGDLVAPSHR